MLLKELVVKYDTYNTDLEKLADKKKLVIKNEIKDVDLSSIDDAMTDVENSLSKLEVDFYKELTNYYFATVSTYGNKLALNFYMINNDTSEIRIQYLFAKQNILYCKANIDDGARTDLGKRWNTPEPINITRLLIKYNPDKILLNHSLTKDISLSDFLSQTVEDFISNYEKHLTTLKSDIYLDDYSKEFVSSQIKPLTDDLLLVLSNLDSKTILDDLDAFHTTQYHVDDFINYAKGKAKEYLYTDLSRNLKEEKSQLKKTKI